MTLRHTLASVALLLVAGGSAIAIHRAATLAAHHEPRGHRGASPAASVAAASTHGSPHLALGTPVDADPTDDHVIVRNGYAVSYNHHRNGPNWAAWRLLATCRRNTVTNTVTVTT